MKFRGVGRVACAVVYAGVEASAQSNAACRDREVERRIQQAVELRRDSMELPGYQILRDLYQRCPSPRVLTQLALAEHGLERWRDAYVHLEEALTHTDDAWVTARRTVLAGALAEAADHLPRVNPQCDVEGAEVRINGERVGELPLPHPVVVPNSHATVEVFLPGYVPIRREITVEPGLVWTESLHLEPERTTATPTDAHVPATTEPRTTVESPVPREAVVEPPRVQGHSGSTQRVIGWGLIGLGVASWGIAVWQGVTSLGQNNQARDATATTPGEYGAWARFNGEVNANGSLNASQVCDAAQSSMSVNSGDVRGLCSSNSTTGVITYAADIAGLVLVGGGIAAVLTAPSNRPQRAWHMSPWTAGNAHGVTFGMEY